MPGRGPEMWRQSCTCGLDARVQQIQIGNVIVGIVGLEDALQQLYLLGSPPETETVEELLAMIRTRNYVQRGSEDQYKAALLREYTAYWEAHGGTRHRGEEEVRR